MAATPQELGSALSGYGNYAGAQQYGLPSSIDPSKFSGGLPTGLGGKGVIGQGATLQDYLSNASDSGLIPNVNYAGLAGNQVMAGPNGSIMLGIAGNPALTGGLATYSPGANGQYQISGWSAPTQAHQNNLMDALTGTGYVAAAMLGAGALGGAGAGAGSSSLGALDTPLVDASSFQLPDAGDLAAGAGGAGGGATFAGGAYTPALDVGQTVGAGIPGSSGVLGGAPINVGADGSFAYSPEMSSYLDTMPLSSGQIAPSSGINPNLIKLGQKLLGNISGGGYPGNPQQGMFGQTQLQSGGGQMNSLLKMMMLANAQAQMNGQEAPFPGVNRG